MRVLTLILREARHRKVSSALVLLAITAAVALPVAFGAAGSSATRETSRLMRDMGYNLRIVPAGTDMERYWSQGYSDLTLPADCVQRFARRADLSYNHLIATLARRVTWRGARVLLTGIAEELSPQGKARGAMTFLVEPGTLVLGWEVHSRLGLARGARAELMGRSFRIAECLAESGSVDDTRVYANLAEVQDLLALPAQVNEIKALECGCASAGGDPLARLRAELAAVVPEGKVIRLQAIAAARERQRRMSAGFFTLVLTLVLVFCALWIAFLAALNARTRRSEIGILRALGHGSARIAALLLGKFALAGLAGAALGFVLGNFLAARYGPQVFATKAGQVHIAWELLPWVLVLAPLFAALASFLPTVVAVSRDPATTLQGDDAA